MKNAALVSFFALLLSSKGFATTWAVITVEDPIKVGATCEVNVPGSYGSYIYDWPSRYDYVFWPLAHMNGVWFCRESGFTSFINDFDNLTDQQRKNIHAYLQQNPVSDDSDLTKLRLLEDIYALRTMDSYMYNAVLRILARLYQNNGKYEYANNLRKKALADIESALSKGNIEELIKTEYLLIAASYSRQFGDIKKSEQYINKLNTLVSQNHTSSDEFWSSFYKSIVDGIRLITPGGKIDPEESE